MTTKEFRKRISESKLPQWFNTVSVTINYPQVDLEIELLGSKFFLFMIRRIKSIELPCDFYKQLLLNSM
jgi:hypothetical protein